MGTGTDDSNIKEDTKKRSHLMARLHRGLLDILKTKSDSLSTALVAHIRSFDRGDDSEFSYTEMMGFWRMLMELVFNGYVQLVHFVGVLLVTVLVVITWPIRCMLEVFAGSWFGKQYQVQEPLAENPPATGKDDSKNVVRRVVYEEAKVEKK